MPPRHADFGESRLRSDISLARLGVSTIFASFIYLAVDIVRVLEAPTLRDVRLIARLALLVCAGVSLAWLGRVRTRDEYARPVALAAFALVLANLVITALRPPTAQPAMAVALFNVMVLYFALPNRPLLQAVPPILMSAGALIFRLGANGGATISLALDFTLIAVANVLGVVAIRRRAREDAATARIWDAEVAARTGLEHALHELRTLRGVIPICAYCHKIRSEVGAWEQLERYITQHTHAEFSHGACPACTERLLRELDTENERA